MKNSLFEGMRGRRAAFFLSGLLLTSFGRAQAQCSSQLCNSHSADLHWFESDARNKAVWAAFGTTHSGARSFQNWLESDHQKTSLPAFRNTLSLNCWEFVLYSALKRKTISHNRARELLQVRLNGEKLSEHMGEWIGRIRYTIDSSRVTLQWPQGVAAGDIVFMDETSHVVQFNGITETSGRKQVISFSPRPIWGDGAVMWPQTNVQPEVTTLESLIEEMIELYPDVPTDWNAIDLKVVRLR